jgi:hypothetical protein
MAMKKNLQVSLLLIFFTFVLVNCTNQISSDNDKQNIDSNFTEQKSPPPPKIVQPLPADLFEIVGTVTYQQMEGGFYAIDGDDGRKYDPVNLPEAFKKDGLKVKGTARRKKDVVGIHMYGEIIEIVDLEKQ